MNFQEALIELQRVRPEAQIGLTAQRGQYYDQAVHMSFRSYDALHFVAVGRHGKEMWLYVNENLGRICCGNKS